MKRSKGFTLMELLTVIVILAVILLIAAPTILSVLEKSKKNTFRDQALLYVDGLKKNALLDPLENNPVIKLPDNGKSLSINVDDVPMDTKTDIKGNIVVTNNDGNYTYLLYITNGEYIICDKEHNKVTEKDIEKGSTCGDSLLYPTITNKYESQTYNYRYNITSDLIMNGVTASDTRDGNITDRITYTSNVDTSKVGTYEIIYRVENSLGNYVTAKRTIIVGDTESPVITNTIAKEEIEKGSTYNKYLEGITVTDNYSQNLTATYICKNGILKTINCSTIGSKVGVYYVIYDAKDSSNNKYSESGNVEVKREILVKDIDAPRIALKGDLLITIEVKSTFQEPGYSAIDDEDGDITSKVETSSNLNINKLGTYTVEYVVLDNAGNRGIETRTIQVVDTTKPEIKKVEGNPTSWVQEATITVTASDNYQLHAQAYSFDDGSTWQETSSKKFTSNGTIKIRVKDSSGNINQTATTVNITYVDATEPTINLDSVPNEIEQGDEYQLPTAYTVNNSLSKGSAVCKDGNTIVTNTSSLSIGSHAINCTVTTGAGKTAAASKTINVKSIVVMGIASIGSSVQLPKINENNLHMSSNGTNYKIYLDKAGYTFDYVVSAGANSSIEFCKDSSSCERIATQSGSSNTYKGSYTTTTSGYIRMTFGGCNMDINNLKYNGVPVIIKDEYPYKDYIELLESCTTSSAGVECANRLQNNSIVSGKVYIKVGPPRDFIYVKINDGEWVKTSSYATGSYYILNTPGTYRIKAKVMSGSISSSESDEYVVTIQ